MDSGKVLYYSSSYSYADDKIEFSETDDRGDQVTCFTLRKIADDKTGFTITVYKTANWITNFLSKFSDQKKLELDLQRSLENIIPLLKEINIHKA